MGASDEYQFDYLDHNEYFADQVNGALFKGRQVVKPKELEPADAQAVYLGKEAGARRNYKAVADKVRLWRGRLIHILAVENQTFVDYHMVLRNMLLEALSYQKQWKQMKRTHESAKDLKSGTDEFLSGMSKAEKLIPVITLVVYCGTEHPWDGAKCLHDLLNVDEELKEFVSNYRLNLYDCHEHDSFDEYKTGLRQLFEVVRFGKDEAMLTKLLEENRDIYSRIDSETRELIETVGKVHLGKEYNVMENGEKKYDMCKAFVDKQLRGKWEYLIQAVCKKLQKNKSAAVIAEELDEDLPTVENIIRIQHLLGNYDATQIYDTMRVEQSTVSGDALHT